MITAKYYWPGLTQDVKNYVCFYSSCNAVYLYSILPSFFDYDSSNKCQRNNHKLQKASGVLHPISVKTKIWSQVGMDLIGSTSETPHGNKYIDRLFF